MGKGDVRTMQRFSHRHKEAMFHLTLEKIKGEYPVAGSFGEGDFDRFEKSVRGFYPLAELFNLSKIEHDYEDWDRFVDRYLATREVRHIYAFHALPPTIALRAAIPVTDVVISKGGIFVTDGDGVTPASTARVERLLDGLDREIETLLWEVWEALVLFYRDKQYTPSAPYVTPERFMQSYCYSLPISDFKNGYGESCLWFFKHYDELVSFEKNLAERYLSRPTYQFLLQMNRGEVVDIYPHKQSLNAYAVIANLTGNLFLLLTRRPEGYQTKTNELYDALRSALRRDAEALHYDRNEDPAGIFHRNKELEGVNFIV